MEKPRAMTASGPVTYGAMATFDSSDDLLAAAEAVRKAGYTRWDCYTPFPIHGLSEAMGLKWSRLPWVIMFFGALGTGTALLMQWWMNGVDYKINISGKPWFSVPANIPVTFELTVLFAAISAFVGMLVANGLPLLYHPAFKSRAFRSVTRDRYCVIVEAADPKFDPNQTRSLLTSQRGAKVEMLED